MTTEKIIRNLDLCYSVFQKIIIEKRYSLTEPTLISWPKYIAGIDKSMYYKHFENLLNTKQYSFLLHDHSLLQFYYFFDDIGLKKMKLAYYPYPKKIRESSEEICQYFDESDCESMLEVYHDMHELMESEEKISSSTFIRIDYDRIVQSHTTCHMQIGAINDLRIPVEKISLPFLFFDFILKNNSSFHDYWQEISTSMRYKIVIKSCSSSAVHSGLVEPNMYLKID